VRHRSENDEIPATDRHDDGRDRNAYAYGGGDFWFGDGPYRSLDDAKLARSTIGACPKDDPRAGE
jgi:hypothetical protein